MRTKKKELPSGTFSSIHSLALIHTVLLVKLLCTLLKQIAVLPPIELLGGSYRIPLTRWWETSYLRLCSLSTLEMCWVRSGRAFSDESFLHLLAHLWAVQSALNSLSMTVWDSSGLEKRLLLSGQCCLPGSMDLHIKAPCSGTVGFILYLCGIISFKTHIKASWYIEGKVTPRPTPLVMVRPQTHLSVTWDVAALWFCSNSPFQAHEFPSKDKHAGSSTQPSNFYYFRNIGCNC